MTTKKTGPSDGSDLEIADKKKKEEQEEQEQKDEKRHEEEQFNKNVEDLKKIEEEMEERKKEKIEKFKEENEDKKGEKIEEGNQKIERRIYSHKRGRGIFIKGKAENYRKKIDKILKRKVHGISLQKKREINEIISKCALKKSSIREKEVNNVLSKLKYRKFTGSGSLGIKKMLKEKEKEGVDIKKYKEELRKKFKRRDIDKFRRAIRGEEDPLKYKMKTSSDKILNKNDRRSTSSFMNKTAKRF